MGLRPYMDNSRIDQLYKAFLLALFERTDADPKENHAMVKRLPGGMSAAYKARSHSGLSSISPARARSIRSRVASLSLGSLALMGR